MKRGREKAKQARIKKANRSKTVNGLSGLVAATRDLDREEINKYLDEKKHMTSFLASVLRTGVIEAEYNKTLVAPTEATINSAGIRVFSDSTTKWRNLRLAAAPAILAYCLKREEVVDWFKGEAKLDLTVAAKACRFQLGLDEGTDVPRGHPLWCFLGPLKFLIDKRIADIGNKLDGVTKETLESRSDWFGLQEVGDEGAKTIEVIAHTNPKVTVLFRGIDMDAATDWTIIDAASYTDAILFSVDADVESKITRAYERVNTTPMYNDPMMFNPVEVVPGFPRDARIPPPTPTMYSPSPSPLHGTGSASSNGGADLCVTPLRVNVPMPIGN